ncbi:centrobin isoform X2 [Varanus komodoensis]|uniref:centrobin isoform X2 n=1 Tax=Varanus komodoensis TaxID=61221 RepID=UPI001CF7D538|nr:centrobin isoform X2 [Varanus komodoensis]
MAEKSTLQTLVSSIHSEDLLSDMELLPGSDPATPLQQVPSSQAATPYTSKVTAQLYTSLHQSRRAEAQARAHLESQHGLGLGLGLAGEAEASEVDLDTLAEELNHQLSTSVEASSYRKAAAVESRHIMEMQSVRSHLQSMLRSGDLDQGDATALGTFERKDDDSFESDSTTALLTARPLQELSPPGSLAGFEELFPRYTSLRLGRVHEQPSYTSPYLLKESLDKERARRKHCERQIQSLQHRILELQQQLAVATSADKKKDCMIEQLDKTLAKVVEGWNRHEAERTAALHRLQAEKEAAEQALGKQKEKISETEGRLEQALSALGQEQQAAHLHCKGKEALEEEKASLSCSLEAERRRVRSLEAELDLEHRQQETLRAALEEQQRGWAQRERQLEQQRQALEEEGRAQLGREKEASQREAQKAADAQRALASLQAEMQGLQAELEAVRRERDSLKVEMSLVKARHEAQKVNLESELKVALEQRVTERLAEVHEDTLRQMSAMREQHRKQLLELSSHHEKELAAQLTQFKSDLAEREGRQRSLTEDYEHRLGKQQEEMQELQARYRRLEAQRAEMVSQFQAMMQAHWNEALRLLAGSSGSPQLCSKAQERVMPPDPDPASDLESPQPSDSLRKTQPVEALGSSQGAGDCGGAVWTTAAPLLPPPAQHNALRAAFTVPEKSAQDPCRPFLPLLPDPGRVSSEFSRVLNCSLLSQQGFQPLDPQVDAAVTGAGLTFHPENLAEHPFTDEADEAGMEGAADEGGALQSRSLESEGQGPVPQPDPHYYLRLLCERSVCDSFAQRQDEGPPDSPPQATHQTQLGTSYHERSTALWDPAQPPLSTIRIQPPSSSAVHKSKVSLPRAGLAHSNPDASSPPRQNPAREEGVLSPRQVAEVSRLLKQYQAKGRPVPSPEELYRYLRGIGAHGAETKSDGNLQTRRNLDSKLVEAMRKEVAPARRMGISGLPREKAPAKAGKKPGGVPASNPRTSRGGTVWR